MIYRQGSFNDVIALKNLAIESWNLYEHELEKKYWKELFFTLNNEDTYINLLKQSFCWVCENSLKEIIGMAFLVPKGNPTEIYDAQWSYIRFVSVSPRFSHQGIGKTLTQKCIQYAKENNEQIIALHTSEMMIHARKLYHNLGFTILKEIEPRLGKKYWLYILYL